MFEHLHKATGIMKNQGTMTPPKKHNIHPVTDLKKWRYGNYMTKKIKIIILKMLREHQENTDKKNQSNEIRKTIQELSTKKIKKKKKNNHIKKEPNKF